MVVVNGIVKTRQQSSGNAQPGANNPQSDAAWSIANSNAPQGPVQSTSQPIQTATLQVRYDSISSDMPLSFLDTVTHLTVQSSDTSSYLSFKTEAYLRVPDPSANGHHIVVFFTPLGRFLLNQTNLEAAKGIWATMNSSEILSFGAGRSIQGRHND